MVRTILLTGYSPYRNAPDLNPSGVLARKLNGRRVSGFRVHGTQIPVAVEDAARSLRRLLDGVKPDAALALGVAPGRSAISVERVALNVLDFRIPDNRGKRHRDRPIRKEGPAAYFSTLPVRSILLALKRAGIPAELSSTAGTYLCNFAMYTLLDGFSMRGWKGPVGFIHIPQVPEASLEEPVKPSMDYRIAERAVLIALGVIAKATPRRPSTRRG
ncbi:MAG TPA: pyroglutamyl-peptidase I [Thermoplasmata archaeon]|jgi:pyroglutamyl-peptidase